MLCMPWAAASALYSHAQLQRLAPPGDPWPAAAAAAASEQQRGAHRRQWQQQLQQRRQQHPRQHHRPEASRLLAAAVLDGSAAARQQAAPGAAAAAVAVAPPTPQRASGGGSGGGASSSALIGVRTQGPPPGGRFPAGGPQPGSGGGGSGGEPDQFGLNFGEAVMVLREDLPLMFHQEMRYHIFREDLVFRTPSLQYVAGLWKYRLLARAGRWLGSLLYSEPQLSIGRMWQPAANKRQLRVRCCISGRLRLSLSPDAEPLSTEVISTYTFDSEGRIYEHQVDQIIPPEAPLVRLLEWLVGRLQTGAVPQPQIPIPGLRDSLGGAQ